MKSSCFGLNTKILMYDGSYKYIQNIKKGDYVLGIDGNRKKVLDTFHDFDDLFEITSKNSNINNKDVKYVVNGRHTLFLKSKLDEIIRIRVKDYLKMGRRWRSKYYLVKNDLELNFQMKSTEDPYDFGCDLILDDNSNHIPEQFKINSRPVRYEFLSGMLSSGGEIIDNRIYLYHPSLSLCKDIQWIARSLGFQAKIRPNKNSINNEYQVIIFGINQAEITCLFSQEDLYFDLFEFSHLYKIKIKYIGEGEYYGISVEDDLFMLNDFDIVVI